MRQCQYSHVSPCCKIDQWLQCLPDFFIGILIARYVARDGIENDNSEVRQVLCKRIELIGMLGDIEIILGNKVDTVQVYFRKKYDLNGTAVTGMIYLTADNDMRFFINEQYILDDAADNFTVLDSVDFSVIQPYLKSGDNILALHVVDTDGTAGGVKVYGHLELIPLDIMASMEQRTKLGKLQVDPVVLKKINTLNKNRITINN